MNECVQPTTQQLALGEECLLLLILLVTEMPVVPDPLDREPSSSDAGIEEHKWSGEGGGGGGGGGGSGGGRPSEITEKTGGGMDSRLARQLRRELVHRLASAPCTHSELQDTCYATSHNETLEAEVGFCLSCLRDGPFCVLLLVDAVALFVWRVVACVRCLRFCFGGQK